MLVLPLACEFEFPVFVFVLAFVFAFVFSEGVIVITPILLLKLDLNICCFIPLFNSKSPDECTCPANTPLNELELYNVFK